MTTLKIEDGERMVGSWSVYMGGEGVNTAKTTGKLYITERNVYFEGGLSLGENAAAEISQRTQAFEKSDKVLKIPLGEISAARIRKKFLILKSLEVTLRSGEQIAFHFGAMSPRQALEAMRARAVPVTS